MDSPQATNTGTLRLRSLDVLRAVAILLVLGRHWPIMPIPTIGRTFFLGWRRGGWVGVDVFFVLSGFLIAGLLFRERDRHGTLDVKRFLIRRGFKIYPSYYLLVLASAITGWASVPVTWKSTLIESVYLQNYLAGHWGHTWSLAVEEHFYLLLPCVLLLLDRRPSTQPAGEKQPPFRGVSALAVCVLLACLALRASQSGLRADPTSVLRRLLLPTHLRLDALMFGVLLARIHHLNPQAFGALSLTKRVACGALGVALLAPVFVINLGEGRFLTSLGFTCNYLGAGALLVAFFPCTFAGRIGGTLAGIGRHSYSIYLVHVPMGYFVSWLRDPAQPFGDRTVVPAWSWAVLYIGLAIGLGVVLSRLIEVPSLRLRDRLYPSRSAPLTRPEPPADPHA